MRPFIACCLLFLLVPFSVSASPIEIGSPITISVGAQVDNMAAFDMTEADITNILSSGNDENSSGHVNGKETVAFIVKEKDGSLTFMHYE